MGQTHHIKGIIGVVVSNFNKFKHYLFSPRNLWEMIQFDVRICFSDGLEHVFNHLFPGNEAFALFTTVARFNHSCVPNVHNSWNMETQTET